jgi:hypothetical protein
MEQLPAANVEAHPGACRVPGVGYRLDDVASSRIRSQYLVRWNTNRSALGGHYSLAAFSSSTDAHPPQLVLTYCAY